MTQTQTIHPTPAQRTVRKARLGLWGGSGSGKTLTALKIARGLAGPEGKILVLDTEHASSSLYADDEAFDLLPLDPPYEPLRFVEVLKAVAGHYDVVVLDSASMEWVGEGGCLEQVDREKAKLGDNAWAAWSKITPAHNRFVTTLMRAPCHLICTLRAKTAYELVEDPKSKKKKPVELGLVPICREEFPYELDIVGRLEAEGVGVTLSITATRFKAWHGQTFHNPDAALGAELGAWLGKGVSPAVATPLATGPAPETPPPRLWSHRRPAPPQRLPRRQPIAANS
jgi:AAA domain